MLSQSRKLEAIAALRQQMLSLDADRASFPCGLDQLLPQGITRGSIVEYIADAWSGATSLALSAAREACSDKQTLVIIDREQSFYPLAGVRWGVGSEAIVLTPETHKDQLWALNQALSCGGVGAVVSWFEKLEPKSFRAMQLAAEKGGSVGLLIRPMTALNQPSWADVQLLVKTLPSSGPIRRLKIHVIRCRHGVSGNSIEVELNDETATLCESKAVCQSHSLHLASELAIAKNLY